MSSTGRKPGKRKAFDQYITPSWVVDRLLEAVELPGGDWLEPCAGSGSIISAVEARRSDVRWTAVEIQEKFRDDLLRLAPTCHAPLRGDIADFLTTPFEERAYPPLFSVCLTNPPYEFAVEFIERCRKLAAVTAMLTRVNFLAANKRADFFNAWVPDVYVLPNRPDFTGDGGDSTEYCWMVFNQMRVSSRGMVQVLAATPKAERMAAKQARRPAAPNAEPAAEPPPATAEPAPAPVPAPPAAAPVATFPGFPPPRDNT